MKATTDNAVGCVCTPLKQHNQQSFFAAGYSLGWSSIDLNLALIINELCSNLI